VFFAALLAVNFYLRWAAEMWPKAFNFPSLLMAAALTAFALSSSVTCEVAAKAAEINETEPAVRWIAVSVVTWLTFLLLELVEWVRLVYILKLDWTTTLGATHLALTGVHWLGVCGCVCWMIYVAYDVKKRDIVAVAMFSHFLNAVWLVLFFALYLTNATLSGLY
jgi:cytochrome c oxidase subunit 3